MSLLNCLTRLGKSVDRDDGDFIRERFNHYTEKGMDEGAATRSALQDFTEKMDGELDDIVRQVEDAGGTVNRSTAEQQPMMVFADDELIDANELMENIDNEIKALDEIVRCAYQ